MEGTIQKKLTGVIDEDELILCHLDDTPLFTSTRSFNMFARQRIYEMLQKDPRLVDVTTIINEIFDKEEEDEMDCVPCHFQILSDIDFQTCRPRQYVTDQATLELQSLSLTKFLREYNKFRKELASSLDFLSTHHDLNLEIICTGSLYYTVFSNIGYNTFTIVLSIASVTVTSFVIFLSLQVYKHTFKAESCSRFRIAQLRNFLLRNKEASAPPVKPSIEASDDEEDPFTDSNNSRALVLRNRYELQPLSRRSARELQSIANRRNAPQPPPPYRVPIPLEHIP